MLPCSLLDISTNFNKWFRESLMIPYMPSELKLVSCDDHFLQPELGGV